MVKGANQRSNQNMDTAVLSRASQQILQKMSPPTRDIVNNVYELKAKLELVRYYHAAAGFPSKPSWLAAIGNGHYRT